MKEHKSPNTENTEIANDIQSEEAADFGSNTGRMGQIQRGATYDIDGDGTASSIDADLIMRYQFGFRGDALMTGLNTSIGSN